MRLMINDPNACLNTNNQWEKDKKNGDNMIEKEQTDKLTAKELIKEHISRVESYKQIVWDVIKDYATSREVSELKDRIDSLFHSLIVLLGVGLIGFGYINDKVNKLSSQLRPINSSENYTQPEFIDGCIINIDDLKKAEIWRTDKEQ